MSFMFNLLNIYKIVNSTRNGCCKLANVVILANSESLGKMKELLHYNITILYITLYIIYYTISL